MESYPVISPWWAATVHNIWSHKQCSPHRYSSAGFHCFPGSHPSNLSSAALVSASMRCPKEDKNEAQHNQVASSHWQSAGNPPGPCTRVQHLGVSHREGNRELTLSMSLPASSVLEIQIGNGFRQKCKCPCQPAKITKPGYFHPPKGWAEAGLRGPWKTRFGEKTTTTNCSLF